MAPVSAGCQGQEDEPYDKDRFDGDREEDHDNATDRTRSPI
jgi:hypothetical protein